MIRAKADSLKPHKWMCDKGIDEKDGAKARSLQAGGQWFEPTTAHHLTPIFSISPYASQLKPAKRAETALGALN
jgi:hypothetical protein